MDGHTCTYKHINFDWGKYGKCDISKKVHKKCFFMFIYYLIQISAFNFSSIIDILFLLLYLKEIY
jgi:hypothetical protein